LRYINLPSLAQMQLCCVPQLAFFCASTAAWYRQPAFLVTCGSLPLDAPVLPVNRSVFQHDSSRADGDDAAASSEEEADQQQQAATAGNGTHTSAPAAAAAAAEDDSDMEDATTAAAAAAAADTPFELTDIDCEVRLLHGQQQQQAVQVDAVALTRAFCKQCCWRVLAKNEVRYLAMCLQSILACCCCAEC
jgi:hypothetical protein